MRKHEFNNNSYNILANNERMYSIHFSHLLSLYALWTKKSITVHFTISVILELRLHEGTENKKNLMKLVDLA